MKNRDIQETTVSVATCVSAILLFLFSAGQALAFSPCPEPPGLPMFAIAASQTASVYVVNDSQNQAPACMANVRWIDMNGTVVQSEMVEVGAQEAAFSVLDVDRAAEVPVHDANGRIALRVVVLLDRKTCKNVDVEITADVSSRETGETQFVVFPPDLTKPALAPTGNRVPGPE